MFEKFAAFLAKMAVKFRWISRETKNEFSPEDLHQDAWVLAYSIGEERGRPIDFGDPADQDLVMAALYVESVKRGDWKMRRSTRIEQEPEHDGGVKLAEVLPARESSDPLIALLAREAAMGAQALLNASYSEAAAYVITYDNLGFDRDRVCQHLAITVDVLRRRINSAGVTVREQDSMFDGIERIPADFLPEQGKVYVAKKVDIREAGQLAWEFEPVAGLDEQ